MKKKFLVCLAVLCLLVVSLTGCAQDNYLELSKMVNMDYSMISIEIVTNYNDETLTTQLTITDNGIQTLINYSIEQLAEISMDENPDSYKVTLVGSVTVENGKIVAQNGDPVSEMVFQEIGNVGFNFKKEHFKNAVFSDGRFTADVTLPKQFMGNDNVDYSNMKVDVTYGVCLKTLALSYSMASGAQVTVNYDFQ